MYFSFKNNFFLRETRDGLWAFSGADLSRARFLTRSSKTLDREHRWNNAGFERRGLSGEKNGKKTSSAKNTELEWTFRNLPPGVVLTRGIQTALHGDPTASKRTGEEGLQLEAEQLHDFVLFAVNTGLRPDEAWRLEFRDVTIVDDEDLGKTILKIEVRGKRGIWILQEYARCNEAL